MNIEKIYLKVSIFLKMRSIDGICVYKENKPNNRIVLVFGVGYHLAEIAGAL